MGKVDVLLYFIMGSINAKDPLRVLEAALEGGITCFQLREKGSCALQGKEKKAFAESCQRLCYQFDVPFIINDDVDLALELNADGVHIGQDDAEARSVRRRIGTSKVLGVSVHTVEEAKKAIEDGVDYVGMGPVYQTTSKEDAKSVAGTAVIKEVATLYSDLPIVGIGGITVDNGAPVFQAGAHGISVISAIARAKNPKMATETLKEKALQWRNERSLVQ